MTQTLISSTLLILVVIFLRQLLGHKIPHRLRYALWLLVALRLLIPAQLGHATYSVADLTQTALSTAPIQQLRQDLQRPVAGPSRAQLYQQLLESYRETSQQQTVPPQIQTQLRQEAQTQRLAPSPAQLLTWLWIAGFVTMGAWFLFCHFRFLRQARKDAVPFPQPGIPVPVMICPHVPTPCLAGLFRPQILLTPASAEDPHRLRHVLIHERTHLRHLDHIWAWVRCICLCLYWFHPLVWAAALLSKRDCELACDEGALLVLGDGERTAYGRTLLDTVTQHRSPTHVFETATAMNETAKQLKERVTYIVKKPKTLWIAAVAVILVAAIAAGCAFSGASIPEAGQTPQLLVDLVHEAEALVEENDQLTLKNRPYLLTYLENRQDGLKEKVTVTEDAIILHTADPYVESPEQDLIIQNDVTIDFIYMAFLDLLLDRHGDGVAHADRTMDNGYGGIRYLDLLFYPPYREEGFSSIGKLCAAITDGTYPAPDYAFYLGLHEPSIRWAIAPWNELAEADYEPPKATTPPFTVAPTSPLENTTGPDIVLPSDCAHLFADPGSWYVRGLSSHYDRPEQVDLAAFFADGFPYEPSEPTDLEWALLKDVEGFQRGEHFRRMKKSAMDEVLISVFGLTLDQTDGVGLEKLTYLEETGCYYFMATKTYPPQIQIEPSSLSQDYMEYTDELGIRHYVSLTVAPNGTGYDYKLTSHRTEPLERRMTTMALLQKLGYSYAEFLYLSQTHIEDHLSQLGYADPETLPLVGRDTIAMHERSLIEVDGQLRLRFRFLSLTDRESLKQWYVRDFEPHRYEEPYLSSASHRWLLELEQTTDGAYVDSYYALLTDALFSAPEAVLQALSECPEEQRQRIADTLPRDMDAEELSVYLDLLDTVEQKLRFSEGDTAQLEALLQLKDACLAPAPTLPAELSEPISKYALYKAVGVCCYYQGISEDMSHRLTDAQKQDYCGYQYRLTCCQSKEEVHDHIRKYLEEDLIDRWPDDLLFTGDDGALYLIVTPEGTVNYYHPVLTEGFSGGLRICAGAYSEDGYIRTIVFGLEQKQGRHRVISAEPLAPGTDSHTQYCDGLYLRLDAGFTVEEQAGIYTFHGHDIKGTILRGTRLDSRAYALEEYRGQRDLYEEAWIDDWSLEQHVWYTVLRSPGITELHALIVDGDDAWELHLQSPDPGRLPHMIYIATDNFT